MLYNIAINLEEEFVQKLTEVVIKKSFQGYPVGDNTGLQKIEKEVKTAIENLQIQPLIQKVVEETLPKIAINDIVFSVLKGKIKHILHRMDKDGDLEKLIIGIIKDNKEEFKNLV